jgi:alpha-glucosidase (family GH31 glycosyl hydrolase)
MLGDSILVAPVLEPGATSWTVYLPKGEWIDACTGERAAAGVFARPTPIDDIPVFVRAQDWPTLRHVFEGHS